MGLLPLVVLFLIRLSGGIEFQSVAVATPMLVTHGLSYADAGALLGAFVLPGIVVTVPAGMLAQRFGDRWVLAGGLLLMALGGGLLSVAPGFPTMLLARVLSGIGGVAVVMLTIKMAADRYARSTALAVVITAWPAGMAVGLLVLGPLPVLAGWRATLAFGSLPALCALPLVALLASVRSHDAVAGTTHVTAPNRGFIALAASAWSLLNAALAVMAGFLPAYLISVGDAPKIAGAKASIAIWSAAAIPLGGVLADLFIGRTPAVVGGTLLTAAMFCITPAVGGAVPALLALGTAFAIAPAPLTAQVGQATPSGARAIVFGWYSGAAFLGMTIAPWLAGIMRDLTGQPAAPLLFAAALMLGVLPLYAAFLRAR
jgi:MFS family permease